GIVAFVAALASERLRPGGEQWSMLISGAEELWLLPIRSWYDWDAVRYVNLAERGFAPGDGAGGLYPLYPLLMRVVSYPLGGDLTWAGLIVSSASFVIAMYLLYHLVRFVRDSIARV